MSMQSLEIEPFGDRSGHSLTARVPGSKSITNRALICAGLAGGHSVLSGALMAEDTLAMLDCLSVLGADLTVNGNKVEVAGVAGNPRRGPASLNVRQSGTTSRFVLPALCLGDGEYLLDGDEAMRARPLSDLVDALAHLGAEIGGTGLPLKVTGTGLAGGRVTVPGNISSQFLSGLLLSAPYCRDPLEVAVDGDLVSRPYIDLTLEEMEKFGVVVSKLGESKFLVPTGGYKPASVDIEPDASTASYFFAIAALTKATVTIEGLGTNSSQGDLDFVLALESMGAEVNQDKSSTTVRGTGTLTGIEIDMSQISDTAQTLAMVAVAAESPTRITGIGFIRNKETDRIGAVATELNRLGIRVDNDPDGMTIYPGTPSGGVVETYDDHRMAMSFAVLATRFAGISIADPGCVSKTFPGFFTELASLRV